MGFFDLSIPYLESDKTNRIKLATMAMELGYSGIAYNRTIKGVMSDRDRCSIPLLTLSSLLKLSPSFSSSVHYHRDLLGVPLDSPFRQYRRLTLCADSLPQAQCLNSGNPVLKTYDFVAIRPMNQTVFDEACGKLEVDIISIDFSDKLPFRLKLPMVNAAIKRGVHFEIEYSNLTANIQTRRQMISNAKLLVDWTRGKNLIISSAAPTVFELRGPYDVANLSSLLGLSMERAKAALSKNCRCLITKALRKRQFYKEAIKMEMVSSGEQLGLDKPLSRDWFKWDRISSGEGDLMLDDLAKSFAACSGVSKTVKAIDFSSVVDGMPSDGFQLKSLISGADVGSQSQADTSSVISTAKVIEQPTLIDGNLEQADRNTMLNDTPSRHETSGNQICHKLFFSADATKAFADAAEIRYPPATSVAEPNMPSKLENMDINLTGTVIHDVHSQNGVDGCELHDELPSENVRHMPDIDLGFDSSELNNESPSENVTCKSDIELVAAYDTDPKVEIPTNFMCRDPPADFGDRIRQSSDVVLGRNGDAEDNNAPSIVAENLKDTTDNDDIGLNNSEIILRRKGDLADNDFTEAVANGLKDTSLLLDDLASHEKFMEKEQLQKPGVDPTMLLDQVPILESNDAMGIRDNASDESKEPLEVTMEEQKHEKADNEFNHLTPAQSVLAGQTRAKRRIYRQAFSFPLKHILRPIPFKKKVQKSRRKAN